MREMQQILFLSAEDGYRFNVPVEQTGKIQLTLIKATVSKQHECIETALDEFIEPMTFDEDTDPKLIKHYQEFFCGEWSGNWHIEEIRIHPTRLEVQVTNSLYVSMEVFSIGLVKPESYLKLSLEVPNRNGEMESYLVEMSVHKHRHGYNYFMKVTEPENVNCTREIVLSNGVLLKDVAQSVGDGWIPALVIERR